MRRIKQRRSLGWSFSPNATACKLSQTWRVVAPIAELLVQPGSNGPCGSNARNGFEINRRPIKVEHPRTINVSRLFLGIMLTKCFCRQKTTGWMRITSFSHSYGVKRVAHSLGERHQHDHLGARKTD